MKPSERGFGLISRVLSNLTDRSGFDVIEDVDQGVWDEMVEELADLASEAIDAAAREAFEACRDHAADIASQVCYSDQDIHDDILALSYEAWRKEQDGE